MNNYKITNLRTDKNYFLNEEEKEKFFNKNKLQNYNIINLTELKRIKRNKIFFFSRPAVQQCGNGIALHWQPIHWLHLCIRQLVVLQINVSTASQDHKKSLNKIVCFNKRMVILF